MWDNFAQAYADFQALMTQLTGGVNNILQLAQGMGTFRIPDLVAGTGNPRDSDDSFVGTPDPFTGIALLFPAMTIGGVSYHLVLMYNGVLGVGANNLGQFLAGLGAIVIDVSGINISGLLTAVKFLATLGSNTRQLSISLQPNGSGDTPIGGMYYKDTTSNSNLLTTNPSLETGDTTGFVLTGSVFTNSTDYAKTGTHSMKVSGGSGTLTTERCATAAGHPFDASIWLAQPSGAGIDGFAVDMRFWNASSGGTQIGSGIMLSPTGDVSGIWRKYSVTGIVPVGATYTEIYHSKPPAAGTYYLDDFFIGASPLNRSLTFEPELSLRRNGTKQEFEYSRKVFLPNVLIISSSGDSALTSEHVVPAGFMGINDVLRFTLRGTIRNQTGSNKTISLNFNYGNFGAGTNEDTIASIVAVTATTERGFETQITICRDPNGTGIMYNAVTQVESATDGTASAYLTSSGHIPNGYDFAADTVFWFSVQMSAASGLLSTWAQFETIEYLPGTDATAETYTWRSQPDATTGYDTLIQSVNPTTNFGTNVALNVGEQISTTNVARSIIKFPLPTLPATAVITSATLKLFFSAGLSNNARDYKIYRMLRDWDVATATWTIWKTGNNWTTAGAGSVGNDYDSTVIATTNVAASNTLDTVCSFALDPTEITKFCNGTYNNYGFFVKADTEIEDRWQFYSSNEATKVSLHPILEITYTIPPTGNE